MCNFANRNQRTIMYQNHIKYSQNYSQSFTGKERDSETGFSYFGARYYDSDILTGWLSVDPLADKYPSLSPYAYCGWNPVKLVDPDGMEIDWVKDASGEIYWDNNAVSQATTKEGEIYLGKEGCKYNNDIGTITHYKSNGEKEYYPYSSPNSNSFGAFPINIPTESYKSGYAQFGSNRSNNRKHAGSDLYAPEGTAVFSTNDGVIITNPYYFYKGTKAIEINHSSYTARYCEIIPSFDISAGMHVKKGEFLGILKAMNIGQSNNTMLHFEMYNNTAKGALTVTSNFPYKRREDLIDPTSFLNSLLFISPAKCVLK